MKVFTIFLTLFLLHINSYGQCANTSNIYTFTIYDTVYVSSQNKWYAGRTKYEVVKEKKGYGDAARCAVLRGGFLAEIDSSVINARIFSEIINGAGVSTTYTRVLDGGGAAYVWLGGNDLVTEGSWQWDGDLNNTGIAFGKGQGTFGTNNYSKLSYDNWGGRSIGANNEPDDFGNNQDALGMALGRWPGGIKGEWNDIDSSNKLYYVIEYDRTTDVIANPTSIAAISKKGKSVIELYPNPAKERIIVGLLNFSNLKSNITYKIVNYGGSIVSTGKWTRLENSLDVSGLKNGQYYVQIETENGTFTKSFSVNR